MATSDATTTAGTSGSAGGWARRILRAVLVLVVLVLLYYIAGAVYVQEVDDDPAFGTDLQVPAEASRAVAVAAALVDREVNQNRWVANDPWFQPGSILDNMPNYQMGIVGAVSRFVVELTDHLARVRGTSVADADLQTAMGGLNYPGDVWIFAWSSTPVQPSSESQYRKAIDALRRYNERLAGGQAVLERRADNLQATLQRIAADIGNISAGLYDRMEQGSAQWLDPQADDVFYGNKGRLYAYYLVLRELGNDYTPIIKERGLERTWGEMVKSFETVATLDPLVVFNGDPDGLSIPNHLTSQGFILLRARFQLYEVIDILQK